MKKQVIGSLIVVSTLAFVSIGVALAHGTPVIAVQPAIAPAGGQIAVTGSEMESGETFTMSLEGASGSLYLGTVTAVANNDQSSMSTPEAQSGAASESGATTGAEPEEGGFTASYLIPDKTPPGSYTVKATAEDGDATETDLTITAASAQASAEPAMIQEPTGALHQIDRSKPTGQVVGVVIVAIAGSTLGLWLVRKR